MAEPDVKLYLYINRAGDQVWCDGNGDEIKDINTRGLQQLLRLGPAIQSKFDELKGLIENAITTDGEKRAMGTFHWQSLEGAWPEEYRIACMEKRTLDKTERELYL